MTNYTSMTVPTPTPYNIIVESNNSLTEWGIFISSLLLSCGGFIAVVMQSFKSSRCKKISLCKSIECDRELEV